MTIKLPAAGAYLSVLRTATAGLAVTSHNMSMLNTGVFDTVHVTKSLLVEAFEGYQPPTLPPGWISDNPLRKIPAKASAGII